MGEHRWTEEGKDRIRACLNAGCTVRMRRVVVSCEEWQRAKRCLWHPVPSPVRRANPIPPCTGKQLPDTGRDNPSEPRS